MGAPAVQCQGLWKKFRMGERNDSLRDLIPALARSVLRRQCRTELGAGQFWALQDISFTINKGEVLGIIGPNGAGKSTLLKILSRILNPDLGHLTVNGRLAALIEVGAGFHADLTGRENIYLNGAVLGMARREIHERIDDIVDFAGVSDFIDTPIKRYSSGMQARLGFSVAAHLDPDILLVDEVLSVGDAQFQQRCLDKMSQFVHDGKAIIFISHNLQAVAELCPQTMLLVNGFKELLGDTHQVTKFYLTQRLSTEPTAPRGPASIRQVRVLDASGHAATHFHCGDLARIQFQVTLDGPAANYLIGFAIKRVTDGLFISDYNLALPDVPDSDRTHVLALDFDVNMLPGAYGITLFLVHQPTGLKHAYHDFVKLFDVSSVPGAYAGTTHVFPRLDVRSAVARDGRLITG